MSLLQVDDRLGAQDRELLAEVGATAAGAHASAFLVGGPVRDLLLRREAPDLDVAVEGPIEPVTHALAERLNARVHKTSRFMTATLVLTDGRQLDIARTRTETYPRPGALPVVEPATLAEDLARRDFTANAMAMALDPERFGRLIDPHDGQADVEARQLRVLHERSFEDDPTRMLRAVRFVLRLEFALEPHTAELLARAVRERRAAGLSGARLRNELRVIFHETPARAVAALQRLGLFEAMGLPPASDEACVATARLREAAQALEIDLATVYPMATCLGIYAALSGQRPAELTARLMLHARSRDALLHAAAAVAQPPRVLLEDASASEIFGDLCRMRPEAALAAWTVLDAEGRARLERYWHELRGTCVEISGTDLIAGGHRPGPGFTGALDAALKAKLDEGADREQQLSIALKALRKPSH